MKIYQLTNCTAYQMMGYIIQTENNKIIVIDGGGKNQSKELYRVLKKLTDTVDMWILTHDHNDHFGSIIEILSNHDDICVKGLWRNNCDTKEVMEAMPDAEYKEMKVWTDFEKTLNIPLYNFKLGEEIIVDGVKIEVLGINNPEILVNNSNNQSVVLKFYDKDFSIIFLGDLGIEGGEKLLKIANDKVKSTAVQMAHHGQAGVNKEVYEKIGAKYAFWPTPKWLWDNTPYLGGEAGKGCFKTPEVIGWMKELNTINITSFENTVVFDTNTRTTETVL